MFAFSDSVLPLNRICSTTSHLLDAIERVASNTSCPRAFVSQYMSRIDQVEALLSFPVFF